MCTVVYSHITSIEESRAIVKGKIDQILFACISYGGVLQSPRFLEIFKAGRNLVDSTFLS